MLNERRLELLQDVRKRVRDGRTNGSGGVGDDLDKSDAETQGDMELALAQMRTHTLLRIDQTLLRLDAGLYGLCLECEGQIAERRLRALPFAVRCQTCEQQHEESQQRSGTGWQRGGSIVQDDAQQ